MALIPTRRKTPEPHEAQVNPVSDDYERGFVNGYRAFREQSGEYVPIEQYAPAVAHQYSSSHWSEMETKGYVDGYHKATNMQCCPSAESY